MSHLVMTKTLLTLLFNTPTSLTGIHVLVKTNIQVIIEKQQAFQGIQQQQQSIAPQMIQPSRARVTQTLESDLKHHGMPRLKAINVTRPTSEVVA